MADVEATQELDPSVKVKKEILHDEEPELASTAENGGSMKKEDAKVKEEMKEAKIKAEKKEDLAGSGTKKEELGLKSEKTSGLKSEGTTPGLKSEQTMKSEVIPGVKSEVLDREDKVKDEERMKREERLKREGVKGESGLKREGGDCVEVPAGGKKEEQMKGEGMKVEGMKGEGLKGEGMKGEGVKGEGVKGEGVKGEGAKRERSRSPKKKKDKKKDKMKKERGRSGSAKRDGKKDKKRKRSKSPGDTRKRKSKWGPDVPSGFSMTAIPAGRSGLVAMPNIEDTMPRFNDEELKVRTVLLENLPMHVTGQELIEFFNGAVLAVTANAVQQAANRTMSPVFSCAVTEEDHGGGDKRKTAELKFRTADGASVGMKLSGIEYKGGKVVTRRPEGYPMPEDGDPSAKLNLHEMSMARLVGAAAQPGKPGEPGGAVKLSIFNLPEVMTEQTVRDLLSQFGKLRMMSLIRDLATGKIKGYGIFEYDDPSDADLAIVALNGFVCGQNVIRVQKLGGAAQQAPAKPQPVAATAMSNSMTQKIVSNPVLAMQVKQGREVGSRPTTVVQLLNAVYQEDLMDDQDYDDIMAEVHAMASKHGVVSRVVIPKPAKDGSYVDGVGKIFVSFLDLTASRKFQMDSNGRKFEQRVVCAAFYPVDKFADGKFKLWSS